MRQVVCPIVLHRPFEILVFQHPKAGIQIVKGGIKPNETVEDAASRALMEESGLHLAASKFIGQSTDIQPACNWHFAVMNDAKTNDVWEHFCEDDGGQTFGFFYLTLDARPAEMDPIFHRALDFIQRRCA